MCHIELNSVTIEQLANILTEYCNKYPSQKDKMIYHDALHISGIIRDQGLTLELY